MKEMTVLDAGIAPLGAVASGTGCAPEDQAGAGETKIRARQIRDRVKELRRVRARDLMPNPKNWRRHGRAQAAALRGLLTEIGYADAVLARELPDGRLMLIDGHLRAETTPDVEVPVLVLDVTEAEADKVLATLDPLAAMAEADPDRLQSLLRTIHAEDEAVTELLRQTAGDRLWKILHPEEMQEVEVSPARAEELREKWRTEVGQLWRIGPHRLLCGDCRDQNEVSRMWFRGGRKIRMVWTDPPYGVSYGEKTAWMEAHGAQRTRKVIANDSLKPEQVQSLFAGALKVATLHAEAGASIYATVPSVYLAYFIRGMEDGGFAFKHQLVWLKNSLVMGRSDYHYKHEPILYGWIENGAHYFIADRTQTSVFDCDRPMASDLHPTTKPVELVARMVANSSRRGELVYDPFCGSGSTLLAAHQLGRIGYGCEIDPGYVAVAVERFSMLGLESEVESAS
jgi:DNA modification methylase